MSEPLSEPMAIEIGDDGGVQPPDNNDGGVEPPPVICRLTALPADLLDAILCRVESELNGPTLLCRLSLTCHVLWELCSDADFIGRCGSKKGQTGLQTLEQLTVLESLRNLVAEGNVRIIFMGADTAIRPGSLARLDDLAGLLQQHAERLTVCIDAHTGRNAPPSFAPRFTRARAKVIMLHFLAEGVSQTQIESANGWGKDIALSAGWQPGIESAHAELFFSIGGVTIPPRPSYYDGRTPPTGDYESDSTSSDSLESESDEDSSLSDEESDDNLREEAGQGA